MSMPDGDGDDRSGRSAEEEHEEDDADDEPLELVIIGAGPHGLALLLRLLDDAPDETGECASWRSRRMRSVKMTQDHPRSLCRRLA